MKVIRFLILLVTSLGLPVTPVYAQGETQRTSFIDLVRQAEVDTSFFVQAGKAFGLLKYANPKTPKTIAESLKVCIMYIQGGKNGFCICYNSVLGGIQ